MALRSDETFLEADPEGMCLQPGSTVAELRRSSPKLLDCGGRPDTGPIRCVGPWELASFSSGPGTLVHRCHPSFQIGLKSGST